MQMRPHTWWLTRNSITFHNLMRMKEPSLLQVVKLLLHCSVTFLSLWSVIHQLPVLRSGTVMGARAVQLSHWQTGDVRTCPLSASCTEGMLSPPGTGLALPVILPGLGLLPTSQVTLTLNQTYLECKAGLFILGGVVPREPTLTTVSV